MTRQQDDEILLSIIQGFTLLFLTFWLALIIQLNDGGHAAFIFLLIAYNLLFWFPEPPSLQDFIAAKKESGYFELMPESVKSYPKWKRVIRKHKIFNHCLLITLATLLIIIDLVKSY